MSRHELCQRPEWVTPGGQCARTAHTLKNGTRYNGGTRRKLLILNDGENGIPSAILSAMTIYQRLYIDGKLTKTSKPKDLETARRWLSNMQSQWTRNLMPNFVLTPGDFDPNNAVKVTRVSDDELLIVTTGGKTLRTINVTRETV